MKQIYILAEGQTEEIFIRDVLRHHLMKRRIYPNVILSTTKRVQGGPNFRGGVVSYGKVKHDLKQLLNNSQAALVTTFLDYYNIPADFPAFSELPAKGTCYERVKHLEQAFAADINHPKFMPYLALHQFEAMLFVDPYEIDRNIPEAKALERFEKIKAAFASPEEIDEERPPSKRLLEIFRGYQKTYHSPLIVEEIGLENIRNECSHFAGWLTQIEAVSDA